MRRGALVLAGLLGLILVVGSLPAAAYVDVGYDPDDAVSYDIQSTARRVQGRELKVVVHTYDGDLGHGDWLEIDARLDARGGRAADAVLRIGIWDISATPSCSLNKRNGRLLNRGHLRFLDSGGVACRVPVRRLRPTKAIRWKVTTCGAHDVPVCDVAPNRGMYG